ncbi:MAG: hypothetical protein D3924_04930 [Candidatus Electrothrix sp. AR4]|nr:hypothetical protein [Candidatus Electrothrix sp. AR4]
MDKLTRESNDHGKIIESMFFFEKFLEVITSDNAPDYIKRLHQFSDEYIVQHFKFEEEKIFPFVLKKGDAEENELIRELQEEHAHILESLAGFKDTISSYGSQPTREQVKKILTASEAVISMILVHTRKEDEQLFPTIKKYNI